MHDEGSVESSLHSTASRRLQHSFENESDWESIESIPRRKKSPGHHGRGDASTESTLHSLEDSDQLSYNDASDDEQEDIESITIHDIRAVEGHLNSSSILSKSYALVVADSMEDEHYGATSFLGGTTKSILCETDSLSFRQISPRRKNDCFYLMSRDEPNSENHAQNKLNSSFFVGKELIPHYAIIEWDDCLLAKRHQRIERRDSLSE